MKYARLSDIPMRTLVKTGDGEGLVWRVSVSSFQYTTRIGAWIGIPKTIIDDLDSMGPFTKVDIPWGTDTVATASSSGEEKESNHGV